MNEFKDGWKPLLAAIIGTMCGLITITNYSQGFFLQPVTAEFGWSPPEFFLGFTVMMCAGLVTGPLIGSMVSKYGLRKLGMIGLVGHAFGYVLLSLNTGSLPLWYATWALLAVLAAASLPIIWTTALNSWFVENRGKAIGICMAGTGIGALLLPPIVEYFISNHGWRVAYQGIGVGAMLLSLPIVYFLFHENPAFSEEQTESKVINWGMTRSQAIKTFRFWVLLALLFTTVIVVVGLLSNFERIMASKGLDRGTITSLASILGFTVIFGRLLVGYLVDRFWAPAVGCIFFSMPIIGMLMLLNMDVTLAVGIFVAIFIGLASGAELDMLAFLTSRYFGPAHYPAIFGAVFAAFSVGAGLAPPITGGIASSSGYDSVLALFIGILVLSLLLFLALGKYPDQDESAQ